jgi:carboxyl-terminal processing protease
MEQHNRSKVWISGFLIAVVFATGLLIGRGSQTALSAENDIYDQLKIFTEVLSLTEKNYVDEVQAKDLVYGAIRGMLGTLDPHSVFMTPEMYKEVQVDTKGEFGGLGIQIGLKDNHLTVISPIEDTPAFRAGIEAGDWIVKVEDESTNDMTLMEAVEKMRGPRGSEISLTVNREGLKDPIVFNITRDLIRIHSVKSKILEDHIGYIRISQFQERTGKDLADAIRNLKKSGMDSLVLDLRNNPGGLLKAALEVSEQFLPPGKLIVSIRGRDRKKDEYRSTLTGEFEKQPMIVLVNGGSASASEIVAGAMQDWARAAIVGTTSFGKGSVQTILPLSDNSGLRLTTARYYTPKGRSIHKIGITPDIIIEAKPVEPQPPAESEKTPKDHPPVPDTGDKESGIESDQGVSVEGDLQLKEAVDLLKTWRIFKDLKVAQDIPS